MAGILTIFSAVFLVLNYLKLNEMIEHKFELMFKHDPAWNFEVRTFFLAGKKIKFFKKLLCLD